jgi:hypothetical protein
LRVAVEGGVVLPQCDAPLREQRSAEVPIASG